MLFFFQVALDSNQQKFDKYSAYFLIKRKSTSTRSRTSVLVLLVLDLGLQY
jgi:hypothetical protein